MKKYASRVRTEGDYGKSPQAAALRLQLGRLAVVEATPEYAEMLAAAGAKRRTQLLAALEVAA